MSAPTASTTPETNVGPPSTQRTKFKVRRMLIPFGAALAVIIFTMVAAVIEAPNPGSDSYLSPQASGGDGSAKLAQRLQDNGVEINRYTKPSKAISAASHGKATIFLPAAEYLNSEEWYALLQLQEADDVRIVVVRPPERYLSAAGLQEASGRIATKTVAPSGRDKQGCDLDEANNAGDAAALRQRYVNAQDSDNGVSGHTSWNSCYDGGLVWATNGGGEQIVAGAPDVFTDAHIDEAGNSKLATGILSDQPKVVWLDQHSLTPEPKVSPPDDSSHDDSTQREPISYPSSKDTSPIYSTLPGWMWAGLVGIGIAGILAALWKGRRLGPPVVEPLPVTVPAAETVHGRARLYRRAKAHDAALRALRDGALQRIKPKLRLSSRAHKNDVVTAAAQRTGWSPQHVSQTLYDAEATNDEELMNMISAIDALEIAIDNVSPQGRNQ